MTPLKRPSGCILVGLGIFAILLVVCIWLFSGPSGYVWRNNLGGRGWTKTTLLREFPSATGAASVVLYRIDAPQDGPGYTCAAFRKWDFFQLVQAPLPNPPSEDRTSWIPVETRKTEVAWKDSSLAVVRIDGWTVAYLDLVRGRSAFARVDLSLETRDYVRWVEQWKAESRRLESEALR